MALTSIELWQKISAANLANPQQCRAWAVEVARNLSAVDTVDGSKVLQCLVEMGRITSYQAKVLSGQSAQPLQHGSWLIRANVDGPAWDQWFEVLPVASTEATASTAATWARWLRQADLTRLKSAAPSLPRALQLASIRHPNLQSIEVPMRVDEELLVMVQPVSGQLLSDRAVVRNAMTASRLMLEVAQGLAALHLRKLVHGRVLPDRMMVNESVKVILLCDPLCSATAILDREAVGLLSSHLPTLQHEQFLAPEFLAPGQLPTLATDVYAFGCTWYWMMTGRTPAAGESPQQILASQVAPTPPLPASLNCPPELERCLAHCLAKNLQSRFPSAVELARALEQAIANVVAATATDSPSPKVKPQSIQAALVVADTPVSSTSAKDAVVAVRGTSPTKGADEPGVVSPTRTTTKSTNEPKKSVAESKPVSQAVARDIESSPRAHTVAQPIAVTASPVVKQVVAPEKAVAKVEQADKFEQVQNVDTQQKAAQQRTTVADGVDKSAGAKSSVTAVQQPLVVAANQAENQTTNSLDAAIVNQASETKQTTSPKAVAPVARRKRRKGNPRWLIMSAGACGFALFVLGILKFSGALNPAPVVDKRNEQVAPYRPDVAPTPTKVDPLTAVYQLVDREEHLWAPPRLPEPIPLDLLPPGGELFIALRPNKILKSEDARKLLALMDASLQPSLQWLSQVSGQPLEAIEHATIAAYASTLGDGNPLYALRITLVQPKSLSALKQDWKSTTVTSLDGQSLINSSNGLAYYVAQQPLVDVQTVQSFSCGPVELMEDVAKNQGAAGPLVAAMERLWQQTDVQADLCIQASPRFLSTDGRGLIAATPERFRELFTQSVDKDARGLMLKAVVDSEWYAELQIIGENDRDAPAVMNRLQERLQQTPSIIESWLVDSPPHPYWRGVALRYPQMLRRFNEYSRFGVENGVAMINTYLPSAGANNLIATTWIALQPGATMTEATPMASTPSAKPPLTIDEYLARPIRLTFDQEPIEVALTLIGEEANSELPAGTNPLSFLLDGDAFEKAGITRNQQVRNFKAENQPVRDVLTELAKRGNPVTTVTDTRQADQKLIWIVAPDPANPQRQIVSLTTREAAGAAGHALPVEFADP